MSTASKSVLLSNPVLRLQFLGTVVHVFCDHMMMFSDVVRERFCQFCIRLALQGMANFGSVSSPLLKHLPKGSGDILSLKRFAVSDDLITSMLRGIRICLFQACYVQAHHALLALKMRAEYELLTNSIQVSHTMMRLASDVKPRPLRLDTEKHSTYHGPGSPDFTSSPADVHASLSSYLLQHNLSKLESSSSSPTAAHNSRLSVKVHNTSTVV